MNCTEDCNHCKKLKILCCVKKDKKTIFCPNCPHCNSVNYKKSVIYIPPLRSCTPCSHELCSHYNLIVKLPELLIYSNER